MEFPERFPDKGCTQIKLTTNYRSPPEVINFCGDWMREQDWTYGDLSFRYPKRTQAREDTFPDTPTVVSITADPERWHQEVKAFLHALRDEGQLTDWNQVAFLFRSVKNKKVRALADYLEAEGIPVHAPRANQFFDREEVRLMLGALMFLFPQFPHVPRVARRRAARHLDLLRRAMFTPLRCGATPAGERRPARLGKNRRQASYADERERRLRFRRALLPTPAFPALQPLLGRRAAQTRRGERHPRDAQLSSLFTASQQV